MRVNTLPKLAQACPGHPRGIALCALTAATMIYDSKKHPLCGTAWMPGTSPGKVVSSAF